MRTLESAFGDAAQLRDRGGGKRPDWNLFPREFWREQRVWNAFPRKKIQYFEYLNSPIVSFAPNLTSVTSNISPPNYLFSLPFPLIF